jgi:hypothetical protein
LHNNDIHGFYCSSDHFGDQIKENEMGGAHGRYGGEGKHVQILEGKMKERDHLEDLGTDRRIILQWILKNKNENGKP